MGLLECASAASIWRGYDYFKDKKVLNLTKMEDGVFTATALGSSNKTYRLELNIHHPRKSKCSCPHANGKRIICKHLIAAYFTIFPEEAQKFYVEVIAYAEEEDKRQEELADKVCQYVRKMKKDELQQALLELLFNGSEWQYEHFIEENQIE